MRLRKLPRNFYLRPTLTVARDLLGKYFMRKIGRTSLIGKIVEVEAYLGSRDPASHAFRGRTKRNEVMFWEGGHLYVYFTYGMHFCANVVTERAGIGHAVLLRTVEPLEGIEIMRRNRRRNTTRPPDDRHLTNGPAKLCEAFGIARGENGTDLCGDSIYVCEGESIPRKKIASSPRIGIRAGQEKHWRFYLNESG